MCFVLCSENKEFIRAYNYLLQLLNQQPPDFSNGDAVRFQWRKNWKAFPYRKAATGWSSPLTTPSVDVVNVRS